MTPDARQQLDAHVQAIAQILHEDAQAQELPMTSLADIEQTVRAQLQAHVSPGIGIFLSEPSVQTIRVSDPGVWSASWASSRSRVTKLKG